MTWLSGNPPQSKVESRRRPWPWRGADARPGPCEKPGSGGRFRAAAGTGDDPRVTRLRVARRLRRAGLRHRRRAGRDRHRAGAGPAGPAGVAARERAPRGAGRGAGAVAGREPRSHHPSRPRDHRGAAARGGLQPVGRPLPAARPGRLRRAALARRPVRGTCRAGRSGRRSSPPGSGRPARCSPPASRCSPSRCPGSPPTRPSASRASSAGATGRASRSCTQPSWRRARPAGGARHHGDRLRGRRRRADRRGRAHVEGTGEGRVRAGRRAGLRAGRRRQREHAAPAGGAGGGARSGSAGQGDRSGAATWATSTARSPTSCWTAGRCTTGSTSTSTAMAPTSAAGWCRARAPRPRTRLTNVAFWPVVPEVMDPAHRSGPLSAVFLALSVGPLGRRLIAEPIRLKHVGQPPYRPAGARAQRGAGPAADARASRRASSGGTGWRR